MLAVLPVSPPGLSVRHAEPGAVPGAPRGDAQLPGRRSGEGSVSILQHLQKDGRCRPGEEHPRAHAPAGHRPGG